MWSGRMKITNRALLGFNQNPVSGGAPAIPRFERLTFQLSDRAVLAYPHLIRKLRHHVT